MGRISKIEKFNLQKVVADAVIQGKSARQIAEICTKKAKQSISHVAISEYIRTMNPEVRKEELVREPTRIARVVNFDLDIIELLYKTTSSLVIRFDWIAELPNIFERRMTQIIEDLKDEGKEIDEEALSKWCSNLVGDLKRNVSNVAMLNRELRENMKFMTDLREKAFELKLMKEFTDLFVESFREEAPEACDKALQKISMNPRMQRIVELQTKGESA